MMKMAFHQIRWKIWESKAVWWEFTVEKNRENSFQMFEQRQDFASGWPIAYSLLALCYNDADVADDDDADDDDADVADDDADDENGNASDDDLKTGGVFWFPAVHQEAENPRTSQHLISNIGTIIIIIIVSEQSSSSSSCWNNHHHHHHQHGDYDDDETVRWDQLHYESGRRANRGLLSNYQTNKLNMLIIMCWWWSRSQSCEMSWIWQISV